MGTTPATAALRGFVGEVRRPGDGDLSGGELATGLELLLTFAIVLTNVIGAIVVGTIAMVVVPMPDLDEANHIRLVNGVVAAGYVAVAVVVGAATGIRGQRPVRDWLVAERAATPHEIRRILRAPLHLFGLQLGLWLTAAVLFGALDLTYSAGLASRVLIIVAITGAVTAACAYLLTERIMRPAAVRALAEGTPDRLAVPGVATRAVLAWAMGTALPALGVVGVGIVALVDEHSRRTQLGVAMVVLGGIAIAVGFLAVATAARATADPVDSVRRGLARIQDGEFDTRVPVYDGTQIGQLQLGFNRMAAGLAERERIRDAFGTYVDREVADHILAGDGDLDGEQVDVTILFVDIRDFTGLAERQTARAVVATINRMFERIVPLVHEHGGHVDKFVGDGLMAVFGAPRHHPDHADRALAAALAIAGAVEQHFAGELSTGVGVNSGPVIAGNVGGGGRFEFSVIGDAVNVAARVEAATRATGDSVLVSEHTRARLTRDDVALEPRPGVELKGKSEPVALYAPT